ncbi:MAG: isopenicillin N synthase-like dioxygenase [Planctomycetota bacterium]|jgi:isopenicillin N synthase-like dioxygenase
MNNNEDNNKDHRVNASNENFLHYDQVEKTQRYRLAESAGDEAFDDEFKVRCCDMGLWFDGGESGKAAFAQELGEALEEIGFAILTGHRIDPSIHFHAEEAARDLFLSRPLAEKIEHRAERCGSVSQGYFPIEETSDIHPDLVEGWVFCRRAFRMPGSPLMDDVNDYASIWPAPQLEPRFRSLVEANEKLILPIMQSMLRYLGAEPHLYDDRLSNPNIGLRLNYYPPIKSKEEETPPGRLLGHEDVGMFVFLPAPSVEGLQVLNRANMKWVRLDAPPGSIILNTGDYMQLISNDRLPSTTHRVSAPRNSEDRELERLTMPMNVYLWEDEMLEPLAELGSAKYDPIKAITFHTRSTAKFYGDDYAVNE